MCFLKIIIKNELNLYPFKAFNQKKEMQNVSNERNAREEPACCCSSTLRSCLLGWTSFFFVFNTIWIFIYLLLVPALIEFAREKQRNEHYDLKYTQNLTAAELIMLENERRVLNFHYEKIVLLSDVAGSVYVVSSLILLATIISIATRKVTALKIMIVLILLVRLAGVAVGVAFSIVFRYYYAIGLQIVSIVISLLLIFGIRKYYKFLENSENVTGEQNQQMAQRY